MHFSPQKSLLAQIKLCNYLQSIRQLFRSHVTKSGHCFNVKSYVNLAILSTIVLLNFNTKISLVFNEKREHNAKGFSLLANKTEELNKGFGYHLHSNY